MALIKKRPKIRLRVPDHVATGDKTALRVELLADKPVEVQGVIVSLIGEAHASVGAGKSRVSRTDRFLALEAVPELGRRLIAGARAYECGFRLPENAPPAFEGIAGWVRYRVKVRVDIPWWPDARETFELAVRGRPAPPDAGTALRFASAAGGPLGTEAYLEGSLSSNVVAPGEVLAGRIALANVAHHRYRSIKVSLVAIEHVRIGRRKGSTEIARYGVELDAPPGGFGEFTSVPFSFRVPEALPGFATPLVSLAWFLEVRAVIRLGFDVEVRAPITMTEGSHERRERAHTRLAPPAVGGERLTEVWQKVAAEVGLALEGERLAGRAGGAEVVLRREARGKEGTFLVGELRYPPLGLGLQVRPATLLSGLVGGARVKLSRDWDSAHRAEARDPAQARAFLAPLVDQLAGQLAPLVTEEMDDQRARVARKDGGREVQGLRAFATDVLALAAVLGEARAPVPPPAAFAEADIVDGWQRLSARLEGRLSTGDMSIVGGALAGARVHVSTVWEQATPVATELSLAPAHRLAVPESGFDAGRVPPEVRGLVSALGDGLRVEPARIALTLAGCERDADVLWQRLSAMATLASRLRESAAGAYR